ncbi:MULTISPECIES: DUF3919 family protein [Clostridium]|uniref:DUF3919 family protein n=1 Tax=Clostridium novyi (strain NT) TaxID=386415 RepID=A0PYF0_CLONN|nr:MULTISPECIES: DUF3919 family protein [Clostridium]ABK60441.1 conserved hypothetical protein [Clostridium novyi NT]KEH86701.1 hypothetical protein Z966_02185 [Clostridium novyi A str. NCTC 538]KEH89079.1 hypothetical protein Z967_11590 [Clostridium novyi A str. 4540]KEH90963.1 hypothetical protein Z965_09095 [Clostridium novyi A str. BKT29909]KEH93004.1 hypothetical protein Z963_04045 [Clostridium botulinum C/D str. It1]
MIRKKIILLYILLFLMCISSFIYYNKIIYNKVNIISNSSNMHEPLDNKLPNKIKISNSILGSTEITDKFLLNDILKYIRIISNSNTKSSANLSTNNVISLKGTIVYLNGEFDNFEIDNRLLMNGNYISSNSYLISILRNMLVDSLYKFNNLLNILNKDTSSIIFSNSNSEFLLNDSSKKKLVANFKKLKIMSNNKDFLETNLNENPKFHLKIYIDNKEKLTSENIILLDVYENYVIIQYLGDENGKNIYVKGNINENFYK